jgi:DNA topoisomerase-1
MATARVARLSADLASPDGALVLRATASTVAFPGYLAAYFDPAAVGPAEAADDAAPSSEAGGAVEEGGEEEGGAAAASPTKHAQQEAARAAAAAALASVQRGAAADVGGVEATAHETRPPPRFTEGSLVRRMEELGIGRPSTYAPTLAVLVARGYARREGRALHAQPLGRVLSAFLQTYFPQVCVWLGGWQEESEWPCVGVAGWRPQPAGQSLP